MTTPRRRPAITSTDVERLAGEAEIGYDVDELIARRPKRGRPALGSAPATVESVRLDPELREQLLRRAEADGATTSEVIRDALRLYLVQGRPMAQPNTRIVTPHSDGWSVQKPGASSASSAHGTQQEAIDSARQTLTKSGGGELAIKGRDGAVRAQDTIPPGNDPRGSRD